MNLKQIVYMQNKILVFLLLFIFQFCKAQTDSTELTEDEVIVDTVSEENAEINYSAVDIYNTEAIQNFYKKLKKLEQNKNTKVRITQIGDSHIQADLFSGKTRNLLQSRFGNAGFGFCFPHSLAKTNGNSDIKFSSNGSFERLKITSADVTSSVGLAGYQLEANAKNFAIELQVRTPNYNFNTIKLVTPYNLPLFDLATTSKEIQFDKPQPKKITHKIKNGESLSVIANKYDVSITAIKKANGLKNNSVRAGKTLIIPSNQTYVKTVTRKEFETITPYFDGKSYAYDVSDNLNKIYIIPAENESDFKLNGIILENNTSGIIYNAIGVNGAKASDYCKFPTFFTELKALESDLIVISLGTNESFDKLDSTTFMSQFLFMLSNIRYENPNVEILVTTPPPSNWRGNAPNTLAQDYTQILLANAKNYDYAVWNLYDAFGGLNNVDRNFSKGIISMDKVHYTKVGYEKQGDLFYNALLNSYLQVKGNE